MAAVVLADCVGSAIVSDEVDVRSAQHFVNSSLAPVLLFRWRLKSVADVLKGIRNRGFTQAGWEALLRFLGCSVSSWSLWSDLLLAPLGLVGLLPPLPSPPDMHVFNGSLIL